MVLIAIPGGEAFAVEGRLLKMDLDLFLFTMSKKDADGRRDEDVLEMELFRSGGDGDGIAANGNDRGVYDFNTFGI